MALTFDLLPACLLRSRWRDWSFLYSCTDRPPFWGQPWTNSLKRKLWNLSFPLLAASVETMLMLSDKPCTSYRSHLRDPKTVLEYPKLPLSRLSDVIKWQAPLKHRQADRQTNMPCLHSLASTRPWQTLRWYGIVWFGQIIHSTRPATWRTAGSYKNKTRFLAVNKHLRPALQWGINRNANIDWNRQFHCCSCLKTQWGPVVKTVERLALGQTGHSGAKPRAAEETRQETHIDASHAGGHVRSDQWRLEGPDEHPLNSCLHSHHTPVPPSLHAPCISQAWQPPCCFYIHRRLLYT